MEVFYFFELVTRTDSLTCYLPVFILKLCKCVCVCVNQYPGANSVTKIWGGFSKPHSVTFWTLVSVASCYVYSLALPGVIIPAIYTSQVHAPTWASPVSVPESHTATWGNFPTWKSFISVPAYWLPTQTSSPFRLRFYYMSISPPPLFLLLASRESSRVTRSCFFRRLLAPPPPPSFIPCLPFTSLK